MFVSDGGRDGNDALRLAGVPPLPKPEEWPERLFPVGGISARNAQSKLNSATSGEPKARTAAV